MGSQDNMLKADRQQLEARMRQMAIIIREKEFTLFNHNFQILGKQAAFLTGQGFGLLYMKTQYVSEVNPSYGFRSFDSLPEVIFCIFVSTGIGLNVLVMVICSWSLVFGADLAVRGDDFQSMKRAVDGLYQVRAHRLWKGARAHLFFFSSTQCPFIDIQERKHTVRLFLCGIGCLILSGFSLGCLALRRGAQPAVMAVFAVTGIVVTWWLTQVRRQSFQKN